MLNAFVTLKYKLDVKKDTIASFSWNQRVNPNLKIIVSDSYSLTKMF